MRLIRYLYILIIICFLSIFFEGMAMPMGSKPKQPDYNLLLITIDTLRADHLGCYGYQSIKTPNIDKLASEGVLFSQTITPVPITLPSHSSIMTGLYPVQHGVRNNGNFFLSPEMKTLAELMKDHNYQTGACVGAFVLDSIFGLDQGFDFYDDNFTPGKRRVNVLFNERNAGEITRVGLRWLEGHKGDRFFLWLHYFDPHSPYFPPFPFTLDYHDNLYDGEIAYVDYCLGELFQGIKYMGLMDQTVVILTADHGEGLGEHDELTHAVFIYDATLKIPLIIKAPGMLEKGKRYDAMVSNMDIMPTVIDLFGLKPVEGMAGKSLMPLINGKVQEVHPRLLCESLCPELNFGWSRLEGVRTPDWKYIQAPRSELYHLSKDTGEQKNLIQQGVENPAQWMMDLRKMKQAYPPLAATEEITPREMDPETEQRLRSLGYVWTQAQTEKDARQTKPDPKDKIHLMNYLDDGMGYLLIGIYDKAIEAFQKIINEDPDNTAGYFNLACAYENTGDIDQAETLFRKVLEMDPHHLDVHNHLGLIHYQREEWDKAQKEFRLALDLVEYSELYYNLSLAYNKKGDFEDAVSAIMMAIDLDPDYSEARNQLGNLYLAMNKLQEAAMEFEKAIELDPTHVTAHNNLGLIYSQKGQIEDAIKEFQEAVRLDPNSAEAHNNLGSLYIGQGGYNQAMPELKKALEIRPDYIKALINLGMLYVNLQDFQNAEELFLKALKTDRDSAEAYSQLGNLYLYQQEFDKAVSTFKRMQSIQPEDPRIHYFLGKAYQALGDMDAALKAWRQAIELQPDLAAAHLNLGNVYFDMGDFSQAEKEWKKALAGRNIDIPMHLVNLGMVYFRSEKYEKAIQAWRKVGELRPGDPNLHFNIALAYFKHGKYKEADHELKECLRLQPDSQNARMLADKIRSLEGHPYGTSK
jgi:type IV pilus biogenesis/stability protein PilW